MSTMTETSPATVAEPGLAEANERLLVRLGFDLHDGPLQQVYALAQDIRLLREQVVALVDSEHRGPVVGRFGDLESQLAELHQDLRDLAHSLEPRSLLQLPLRAAVERELSALSRRTGLSNREIGRQLWISEQTVKFHLRNVYRKLGISSRTEAARYAYRTGRVAALTVESA